MITFSQNYKALGHDVFSNADDPLVKYSNIITEVGELNANDLSILLAGRESCCGTPAPLTKAETFAPGHVNTVSIGSNDDNSLSIQGDSNTSFPLVLHSIVSDEAFDNAIHWLPCGKRFIISDKKEFAQSILPLYFGGRGTGHTSKTKFTSFTRRLKRWNFSRVPAGCDLGAYSHKYFLKGQPELAKKIVYPLSTQSSPSAVGKSCSLKNGMASNLSTHPKSQLDTTSPIKKTLMDDSVDDMNQWLSSTEYELEGLSFPSSIDSIRYNANPCPDVDAHSDLAFLHTLFPSSKISGGWPPKEDEDASTASVSTLNDQMRCHSYLDPLFTQRSGNLHNVPRSGFGAYPFPGAKLSRVSEASLTSQDEPSQSANANLSPNNGTLCALCSRNSSCV